MQMLLPLLNTTWHVVCCVVLNIISHHHQTPKLANVVVTYAYAIMTCNLLNA